MTLAFVARASKRILAKYGQDAFLRGVPAGKVAVIRDIENAAGRLDDANDNHIVSITVGVIDSAFNPKPGDALSHPDGEFLLDRKVEDTGYVKHFILVTV